MAHRIELGYYPINFLFPASKNDRMVWLIAKCVWKWRLIKVLRCTVLTEMRLNIFFQALKSWSLPREFAMLNSAQLGSEFNCFVNKRQNRPAQNRGCNPFAKTPRRS